MGDSLCFVDNILLEPNNSCFNEDKYKPRAATYRFAQPQHRPTVGTYVVPFKTLNAKQYDRRYAVLEFVPLRGEKNSSHTHKIGSWYLLKILFKISLARLGRFYMGVLRDYTALELLQPLLFLT